MYGMHCVNSIPLLTIIMLKFTEAANALCPPRRLYVTKRSVIMAGNGYILHNGSIRCSRPNTVFEIRYMNGALCACDRLRGRPRGLRVFLCKQKIPSTDVDIILSSNQRKGNCNLVFNVFGSASFKLNIDVDLSNGELVKPSVLLPNVPKIVTSYSTIEISVLTTITLFSHLGLSSFKTILASSLETISQSSSVSTLYRFTTLSSSPTSAKMLSSRSPVISTPVPSMSFILTSSLIEPPTSSIQAPFSTSTRKLSSHSSSITSTPLLSNPPMTTSSSIEEFASSTPLVIQVSPTSASLLLTTTLPRDKQEELKYREDVAYINKVDISLINISDKKTFERVLDAATNLINSNRSNEDKKEDPGLKAIQVLQDVGKAISEQLDLGNESSVTFQETRKHVVFGAAVINTSLSSEFSFPSTKSNKRIGDEKIDVPSSVFKSDTGKAFFVGIIFNGVGEMRNKTGSEGFVVGSKVINAVVSPPPPSSLTDPVRMTFEKNLVRNSFKEACSFWIENSSLTGEHGRWSTTGCEEVFQNKTHIQCACYHFTNFAVLFKVTDDQDISEEDSFRLMIITYVGLGLSILGCFLTFVIYLALSNIKSERATIHTNLVFALGVADIIFLITSAVKPVENTCLVLAMLAFFFYLAVFFWMFVEGVYIYLMVIKVFRGNTTRRRRLSYLIGWGLVRGLEKLLLCFVLTQANSGSVFCQGLSCPLLIGIVTWVIFRENVISKYHCWLSVNSGAIWAFVGPGLFIILVNSIILIALMRTTWATFVDDKEHGGLKSAAKTFGAVIPVLGITWVFGVMAFNETSAVFQYIFATTNSIQGMLIFILYCLVNNEVRHEIHRRITIWHTRRDISSSSAARRLTYAASSEKNNRTLQSGPAMADVSQYPLTDVKDLTVELVPND